MKLTDAFCFVSSFKKTYLLKTLMVFSHSYTCWSSRFLGQTVSNMRLTRLSTSILTPKHNPFPQFNAENFTRWWCGGCMHCCVYWAASGCNACSCPHKDEAFSAAPWGLQGFDSWLVAVKSDKTFTFLQSGSNRKPVLTSYHVKP